MGANEKYGSGTTPQKSDTKRMLWAKAVIKVGGTVTKADTCRMLKVKLDKAFRGVPVNNNGA